MKFGYLGTSGIEVGELKFKHNPLDENKQIIGYYDSGAYPMLGTLTNRMAIKNGLSRVSHSIYAYRVLKQEIPFIVEDYEAIKTYIDK